SKPARGWRCARCYKVRNGSSSPRPATCSASAIRSSRSTAAPWRKPATSRYERARSAAAPEPGSGSPPPVSRLCEDTSTGSHTCGTPSTLHRTPGTRRAAPITTTPSHEPGDGPADRDQRGDPEPHGQATRVVTPCAVHPTDEETRHSEQQNGDPFLVHLQHTLRRRHATGARIVFRRRAQRPRHGLVLGLRDVVRIATVYHPYVQRQLSVERQRLEHVPGQHERIVSAD